jgi:hypothetical protein
MAKSKVIKSDDLKCTEHLSIKASNLCRQNKLLTLNDLLDYYQSNKSFMNLRNCGRKTELELREICCRYEKSLTLTHDNNQKLNPLKKGAQEILNDNYKFEYLYKKSRNKFTKLTNRAKNSIKKLIESDRFILEKYLEIAVFHSYNYNNIRAVGKKTVVELCTFENEIKSIINELLEQEVSQIDILVYSINQHLKLDSIKINQLKTTLSKNELNLTLFFDNYVFESQYLSPREKDLTKFILHKGKTTSELDLKNIVRIHGITREQALRLSIKIKNEFCNKFIFVNQLLDYCYDLRENLKSNFWKISLPNQGIPYAFKSLDNSINTYTNILSCLGGDLFYTISSNDRINNRFDKKNLKFWRIRGNYTIKKSLIDQKTLLEIFKNVYAQFSVKISKDYVYTFDKYNLNEVQLNVCKIIISEHFELKIRGDGLLLNRNDMITLYRLIEDILRDNNDLMTAEDIQSEYDNKFPLDAKSISSIIGGIRNSNKINYYRGSGVSKYGLKKWEKDRGLKSGSIKNICLEYMKRQTSIVHQSELVNYILEYRKTNSRNIITNLKLDPKKQIVFFKGGFIGLTSKVYPKEIINSLRNFKPQEPNKICSFIISHIYCKYDTVIEKFSRELGVKPIQIKHIIDTKCAEGILRKEGLNIYYNLNKITKSEEQEIIKLFKSGEKFLSFQLFNKYYKSNSHSVSNDSLKKAYNTLLQENKL